MLLAMVSIMLRVKEVEIDKAINAIYRIPPNQKVKIEVLETSGGAGALRCCH